MRFDMNLENQTGASTRGQTAPYAVMLICCLAMLAGGAIYFSASGGAEIWTLADSLWLASTFLACVLMHVLMHVFMGKKCPASMVEEKQHAET